MVSFVLADTFNQIGVGEQCEWYGRAPGFRISLRIIESDPHLHPTEIDAAETFGHSKRIAVGMPRIVEPALVVEADSLGNEGVAFPFADGIAEPARISFWRERAAVGKNLPIVVELLIQNYENAGRLDNLEGRIPHQHAVGNAVWNTSLGRAPLAQSVGAFLVKSCCPRLEWSLAEFDRDVLQIFAVGDSPHAGQIRLTIRGFRRRGGEVWFPVRRPRCVG